MVPQEEALCRGLKAMADGTRLRILRLLQGREMSVLQIAEEFPMSRPAISKHLRILRDAGLVVERPSGRQRLYALDRAPLVSVASWLRDLTGGAAAALSARRKLPRRATARPGSRNDWQVW